MLGQIVSEIASGFARRKQRKHEKELAEYTYSKDLEQWHRQNEYNKPTAQMSRLREAGLNPNLVYGTGTVTGNTTAEGPKYQQASPRYSGPQMNLDIVGELAKYRNLEVVDAQADLLREKALTEAVDRTGKAADNKLKQELSQYASERALNMTMKEAAESEIKYRELDFLRNSLAARIGKEKSEAVIKQVEAEIATETGLRPGDPIYPRLLFQFIKKMFPGIVEVWKNR